MPSFLRMILTGGLRLGAFRGIPVTVNWTVLPIAALFVYAFTNGLGGGATGLALALLGVVAFFGSIVAHEFGHALTARRFGIRTASITLHLFGGVARIEREPATPRQEFLIAAAGPAVSLVLALAFAATWIAATLGASASISALLFNLAFINLILGIFNLLPGYPMDGGRLLRAYLWQRSGSLRRATWRAAQGGEVVAIGLMGLGFLGVLDIIPVSGVMTLLLGWFLLQLARAEKRRAQTLPGANAHVVVEPGGVAARPVLRGVVMGEPQRTVVIVRRAGNDDIDDIIVYPPRESRS